MTDELDLRLIYNYAPFVVWYNHNKDFIWYRLKDANGVSWSTPLLEKVSESMARYPENYSNIKLGYL